MIDVHTNFARTFIIIPSPTCTHASTIQKEEERKRALERLRVTEKMKREQERRRKGEGETKRHKVGEEEKGSGKIYMHDV